jgi:SAM-dependent methyltransferase
MSHQHGHHGQRGSHGHDIDWAERGAELVTAAEVGAPAVNLALDWLVERLPAATAVMDIGAGPGVAACALATRLPDARVLAVDGAKPLLALARARAERLGVADRVTVRLADLPAGLADLPPADLVWVSGVVHHLPDPVATLRTLGALVRRGGLLAIREGGLPARFLPDGVAPGLLPRLEAHHRGTRRGRRPAVGDPVARGRLAGPDAGRRADPGREPHLPARPARPAVGRGARLRAVAAGDGPGVGRRAPDPRRCQGTGHPLGLGQPRGRDAAPGHLPAQREHDPHRGSGCLVRQPDFLILGVSA